MSQRTLASGLLAILRSQARRIRLNRKRALRRFNPNDLHDLRVAMRRFRAGLRLVRRYWPADWHKRSAANLAHFLTVFGPLRDAQVRAEFIARPDMQERCAADTGWQQYVRQTAKACQQAQTRLRRILKSRRWQTTQTAMDRCLGYGLPRLAASPKSERLSFVAAVAKRVAHVYRRIARKKIKRHSLGRMTATDFHDLRRLCRCCRYLVEFLRSKTDVRLAGLHRHLKNICDALGDLHDADVHLQCLKPALRKNLPALTLALHEVRRQAIARFWHGWRKICCHSARQRLRKAISVHAARR